MLKNLPKILSPEILKALDEMGHGDEVVIADGNFPAASISGGSLSLNGKAAPILLRADGHGCPEILEALLRLIPLDTYSQPNVMYQEVVPGDKAVPDGKPPIWASYQTLLEKEEKKENIHIGTIERFKFYERAAKAYCIIASGEDALYGNIILKKGVIV
jgi:L-fucose mutarotase